LLHFNESPQLPPPAAVQEVVSVGSPLMVRFRKFPLVPNE
jgi:hypothetical protein